MKSKCNCKKYKHVKLKPVAPKYEIAVGFFLEGNDEAFLMVDNYPFNKLPFPSVGDKVNLDAYGNFDFDYYTVKEIYYNLCNPETETFTYIEVTVSGHYFEV
jgi:hypothetical protein